MEYKILKYSETITKDIEIECDATMFPNNEDLFEGLKMDHGFEFVSSTYLNGFINYVKILNVFLTFEYGYEAKEETLKKLDEITNWIHPVLGQFTDSVIIIGELEDSYVLFAFDADVSDCSIYRISKERHTYDDVLNDTLRFMKERQNFEYPGVDEYVELPKPYGWVRY